MNTRPRRSDRLVALALGAATVVALGLTHDEIGVPRDEGIYFHAAELYWGWFAELGDNIAAGRRQRRNDPHENGAYPAVQSIAKRMRLWRFEFSQRCSSWLDSLHTANF